MTREEREHLADLCVSLEGQFSGVVAGFEGFDTPYLGGRRSGVFVVEVFNVPEDQEDDVLAVADDLLAAIVDEGGPVAVVSLWSPEETQEHFHSDLRAIELARRAPGSPVWVHRRIPSFGVAAHASDGRPSAVQWESVTWLDTTTVVTAENHALVTQRGPAPVPDSIRDGDPWQCTDVSTLAPASPYPKAA